MNDLSALLPALRRILLRRAFPAALLLALSGGPETPAEAQTLVQTPTLLTGTVTDPMGALIRGATVTLHPVDGPDIRTATDTDGRFSLSAPAGIRATLTVEAEGFAVFVNPRLAPTAKPLHLNIQLQVRPEIQQVEVLSDASDSTDPNKNGDAITLKGKDIDKLPLDSSALQQELNALAGSPNPDIYVDGFSGGRLPPRDTIREIRINQNPFSAQNDTNPGNGQVQIFTKPGTGTLHGFFLLAGNDSAFNSLNPFVKSEPAYYSDNSYAYLSGPLGKHASFFINGGYYHSSSNDIVDAQILDASLNQVAFTQAVSTPSTEHNFSTRLDFALGAKSTLIFRYDINSNDQSNGGVGQFALPTQGYDNRTTTQTFQLSNSQIVSKNIVNDTRFQYVRSRVAQTPVSTAPTIAVQGAFTGGGNNGGAYNDNQDRYELQNYVSYSRGKQFISFGGRLRSTRDANHSLAGYNGEYIFPSLTAYQIAQQGIAAGRTSAQIAAAGGGPSQFTLTTGSPNVAVSVTDGALFFQDDWKARPNLTLSGGLRFETQDAIHDHADWAPRFGFAWGLHPNKKKQPLLTLRGGAGIFYRRFTSGYLLQSTRQNGVTQQQYIVNSPGFYPAIPAPAWLGAAAASTTYQIAPAFHSPYSLIENLSLERSFGSNGNLTFTWFNSRGVHTQLTRNINAPLPGTYNSAIPTSGTRPYGTLQNIYEYESSGTARETRLTLNLNLRAGPHFSTFGYYQYRRSFSDDNAGGFPSNQYNVAADYGPAPAIASHYFNLGSAFDLPFRFSAFTFIRASSGLPFNLVLGQDLNGDAQFNDRPTFATDLTRASVVVNQYGAFDTSPMPSQTVIPFNYARGPGLFTINLSLRREFSFGPALKPPAGSPAPKLAPGAKPHIDRKYTLGFGADAQNLLNHENLSTPVGTLGSPLFGRSTALAPGFSSSANRIIQLQSYFRF